MSTDAQIRASFKGKLAARLTLLATARRKAAYWRNQKAKYQEGTKAWSHAGALLAQRERLVRKREQQVATARSVIARHTPAPLRELAYKEAAKLVGIMEEGGNNSGKRVGEIIRGGGGNPAAKPAWCGYTMAYVYRKAGSTLVDWHWAAVRLMMAAGLLRTSDPQRGDIVRYSFDHTGMFVRWINRATGLFEAIEGNTGPTGAVSDGDGGDGVYRKRRTTAQVSDFLRVPR